MTTHEPVMPAVRGRGGARWRLVRESLTRPYRVTPWMVLLVSLVPAYLFIPELASGEFNVPEIPLDDLLPLRPEWSLIYGALYGFLIVLPVLVVRQPHLIRRTVFAYLSVWLTAYAFFVFYPTAAPRPEVVEGDGFGVWGLRALYGADPPYNCFPSLHVAHSFVSAYSICRVHRGVGLLSILAATLVGLSTVLTKQHYVVDVVSGFLLATLAAVIFLLQGDETDVSEVDRNVAPLLAGLTAVVMLSGVVGFWVIYLFTGR
jgi:membrane-associated phospholipid phosphatase